MITGVVDGSRSDGAAPDLTRTAAAVRASDEAWLRFRALDSGSKRDVFEAAYDDATAALAAVGEAFAADTSDRNAYDTAKLTTPNGGNGWLRRMLFQAGHEGCALTPDERKLKGWGW